MGERDDYGLFWEELIMRSDEVNLSGTSIAAAMMLPI